LSSYKWEWCEDIGCCEVEIIRDNRKEYTKHLSFKYNENKDDLSIELSEDSFETTREFDSTVKYFWMLIAPAVFPDN